MTRFRSVCLWISLVLLALAACSPGPTGQQLPSPSLTLAPSRAPTRKDTERPSASVAPQASITPQPSSTNTQAPTVTPTLAPTSTPRPTFAGFQVEFVDYSPAYGMQFAFIVPGIQQNYELDVNGKPYPCKIYEKYPGMLFCTGPVIAPKTQVKLAFITLDASKQEVFSTRYVIPAQSTPTIDPTLAKGFNPENCPVRGVNVRCETEYRVLGSGCCVVSTCVDACGYYYSVDTCPEGMAWQGICEGTPPVTPPVP